ncbi:hypothetical protein BTJ40_13795 [Microbulbifer sp. A4B17]|nr:hypothetical protein BTJ40_13795 [Microbulbifer sp. A4B17]
MILAPAPLFYDIFRALIGSGSQYCDLIQLLIFDLRKSRADRNTHSFNDHKKWAPYLTILPTEFD